MLIQKKWSYQEGWSYARSLFTRMKSAASEAVLTRGVVLSKVFIHKNEECCFKKKGLTLSRGVCSQK